MFKKLSKLASRKKPKIILVTVLALAGLILIGEWAYNAYISQPVGTKKITSYKGNKVISGTPKTKGGNPLVIERKKGVTYPYLFETRIKSSNIAYKKLPEFPKGEAYLNNETAMISRMDTKDIKSVNTMWQKNSSHYNFSTPDNRFAAGIGIDSAQMVDYLKDTPSQSLTWIDEWTSTIQSAKTPVSQAVFGLIVDGTVKANLGMQANSYFVPVQGTLSFGGITQYTSTSGTKKAPKVITPSGNINLAKSMLRGINSLYQVRFNQNLLGKNYILYAYIGEYGSGKLRLIGYWYDSKSQSLPESVLPLSIYRNSLDYAVKKTDGITSSNSSISWSEFYNTYK